MTKQSLYPYYELFLFLLKTNAGMMHITYMLPQKRRQYRTTKFACKNSQNAFYGYL